MENVCCFVAEISSLSDRRCKQKISSEPNWNEGREVENVFVFVCVCLIDAGTQTQEMTLG